MDYFTIIFIALESFIITLMFDIVCEEIKKMKEDQ